MVDLLSYKAPLLDHAPLQLLEKEEVIVIVDDSPEITLILEHYLTRQGYSVRKTGNAEGLYQLLHSQKVALVLLDIGLPDRDGTEILADIVPKFPDLGIIMVTGTTDLQTALDCLRVGADDYLTKPVNLDVFHHTIKQTLKKRRLAIDNRLFQKELARHQFPDTVFAPAHLEDEHRVSQHGRVGQYSACNPCRHYLRGGIEV